MFVKGKEGITQSRKVIWLIETLSEVSWSCTMVQTYSTIQVTFLFTRQAMGRKVELNRKNPPFEV